jgi:predicted acylesterase/phospholipase RssA
VPTSEFKAELEEAREAFRGRMDRDRAEVAWKEFRGRIALVLSGGGARGAYQVGALLAFQDARLPTHIITATSIGGMNAAGYAAYSNSLVGNAEPLVEYWMEGPTPSDTGIEWTRYGWILAGLVAACAGFGNLFYRMLNSYGFIVHLEDPKLTWLSVAAIGLAVLLLHDSLPYLPHLLGSLFQKRHRKIDWRRAALSFLGNVIVIVAILEALYSLRMMHQLKALAGWHPLAAAALVVAIPLLLWLRRKASSSVNNTVRRVLRVPLKAGLFTNLARERFVSERGSAEKIKASPIRILLTATDLETGTPRFFSNTPVEQLITDPGVDKRFVTNEVIYPDDLIGAVIASSAVPITYEPVRVQGHLCADGGLCANQPMRPAVHLGADVLFVVMMDPVEGEQAPIKTFLDVGVRSLEILMRQNLLTDLRVSNTINVACEHAATRLGLRAEEVELEMGERRYRYLRAFAICPPESLPGSMLDFSSKMTGPAILQGYRDASGQIANFLSYARESSLNGPRRTLRWALE